jgi:hypothetical protein
MGFHASAETIAARRGWLATQGLIGCRDPATAEALQAEGIAAEVTGCLTFSLPERPGPPTFDKGRVLVVVGEGTGALPPLALQAMPDELLARAEIIVQRRAMTRWPLTARDMEDNDRIAAHLLARYRAEAMLVVTPLHHVAAPCMAAGIPVVVIRGEASARFGFLQGLTPVHLAPEFGGIDWAPEPVDLAAVKAAQWARFSAEVAAYL